MPATRQLIEQHLKASGSAWSIGVFGALTEFMYDELETVTHEHKNHALQVVSCRGAISLVPVEELRSVAFETFGNCADGWSQGVAFCLPKGDAALPINDALVEIGPDREALRLDARDDTLFDLGIGSPFLKFCVRSNDPALLRTLRANTGRSLFEAGNPSSSAILEHSPDRVGISSTGRIEVYQPIPSAHGETPEGPHTHLLPKLLNARRTHAASTPIPDGWVPCFSLYPNHPLFDKLGIKKSFDRRLYDDFQQLLACNEGREHLEEKQRIITAVIAGTSPDAFAKSPSKWGRLASRVALRQLPYLHDVPDSYPKWLDRYDRGVRAEAHEIMPGEGPVGEAA